jgi:hypothetical protein
MGSRCGRYVIVRDLTGTLGFRERDASGGKFFPLIWLNT